MKHTMDSRGYVGGERKRVLTPEQVMWAREASNGGASAAQIQRALADVGVWLATESVRRMLRGETYSNVGRPMRTGLTAPRAGDVEPLVQVSEAEVEASGRRLQELLGAGKVGETPADPAEIMRKLAAGVANARAASGDGMLDELRGKPPGGEDPFAPGEPSTTGA